MEIDQAPDPDYDSVKIDYVGFVDPYALEGMVVLKADNGKEFHMRAFSGEVAKHISSFDDKEKSYTAARQGVARVTLSSQTQCDISEIATSMGLSSEELMTNFGNSYGNLRNYIRKRTRVRNGQRRRANGRSLRVLGYG